MRRLCLAGLLAVAGCQNLKGPFEPRPRPDNPCLPTEVQEREGRDRFAYPVEQPQVAPRMYIDRPSPADR